MAFKRSTKFSKRKFRRGRRRGRRATKLSKGMKRAVTSIVRRDQETKCVQYNNTIGVSSYGSNVQALGFIPLTPYATFAAISQGTGQGDRIGDAIRIVKATLSYVITPSPYNAVQNPNPVPQEVSVRIFAVKNTNVLVQTAGSYFQFGNGSQTPTGNLIDLSRTVNNQLYSQYRMIRHKVGYSQFTGTGSVPNFGNYSNNDYPMNVSKTVDYTKYCPKIIRFNDNTSTPSTRVLQTWIESVNADNSTSAITVTPLQMVYTISIWFKDA